MKIANDPSLIRESDQHLRAAGGVPDSGSSVRPWEVARWGRLMAGGMVLLFTAFGLLHHPWWLLGTLGVALNLMLTALTDQCLIRNFLVRLGAKEREDLFLPGGAIREEKAEPRRQPFEASPPFEGTPAC